VDCFSYPIMFWHHLIVVPSASFLMVNVMFPVKYVAKLEDGTVVSKSPDEGVQFIVEDGTIHSLSMRMCSISYAY